MKIKPFIFILLFILSAGNCLAGVIGFPAKTIKYGVATRLGTHNIDSINGKSRDITTVQPFNLIVTDWLSNGLSYWIEPYYANYQFQPAENRIGQELIQYGARTSLMYNFFISKNFQPWVGMGIDSAYSKFSKRHTVDFEGFLDQRFASEKKFELGYLIHAQNAWEISNSLSLGLKGEYRIPLSDSILSSTLEFFVLYRGN